MPQLQTREGERSRAREWIIVFFWELLIWAEDPGRSACKMGSNRNTQVSQTRSFQKEDKLLQNNSE